MDEEQAEKRTHDSMALAERIKPLLAGHDQSVQGAALADLTSLWLAGHPAQLHGALLKLQFEAILALLPSSMGELVAKRAH